MKKGGSCVAGPHYTTVQDINRLSTPSAGRWNTHAWSSKALSSEVRLRQKAVFDFHAMGANGATGTGALCLTVIRRLYTPSTNTFKDEVISNATNSTNTCTFTLADTAEWHNFRCNIQMNVATGQATDGDGIPYWQIPAASTLPAGSSYRLMLVATVPTSSDTDVVLSYDNPDTPSFLQLSCDPNYCGL